MPQKKGESKVKVRKSKKPKTALTGKRQTAEEALTREREILLAKNEWERTFDVMPDLVAILDNEHRIKRVNKAMAQRLGVNPEDCVGLNCFKCVHKLDAPPSFCPHSLTITDGKEHIAEVHEDNLGGDFLVSTTPLFDSEGRIIGSVHVARDITERKKNEEEIKSLSRFPAENPNVVMRISKDGNLLYSNQAGLPIIDEWKCQIGQSVPSQWRQLVTDVFKSGIKRDFEEEYATRTFLITLAPVAEAGYINVYGRDISERKKAEEALRKARDELEMRVEERTKELKDATEAVKAERKRFFDVLEMLPAYLVLLTPDYHVSYANRFFRERFGEDMGRRCFEYLFNRSEPCETCETYKTLKKMGPLEWEWTGPDGHNYYIYDSPFTDVDGSTLIMEVGIDITERKKAEEALRKAHAELETRVDERTRDLKESGWKLQAEITEHKKTEENLRQTRDYLENLIDYANAPIVVWDPNYRITRFNHAFERLTGLKAEDVVGKQLEILFPEDSKEDSLKHIYQAASGTRWETVEIPILRTDGSVRTVLWNSANILEKDGKTVVATIAQGEDITERKQAEKSLRESQIDLNRAQAVAKTGSWRLDVLHNVLLWSDETHRMFGIPKGTPLTYETFLNAVYPEDREYVNTKWQAATTRGEPYDIEHRIIADGKVKWVREKAELEFDKDKALLGGFGTVQEITEVKEMQAKLEEYSQHLEQLVEEKTQKLKEAERLATIGETAGMVGHDIRNPLQSIEGAVYLAKEELKALPESEQTKELKEIFDIIENQTNYVDHIVADLQDFARTPMPQPKEANIQELITESLSMIEAPQNIEVQTAFQEDFLKVTVDPVQIKRVLLNLIENAVQAMPNGGRLTVKAFCEPEAACVCVEDTGSGISEKDKPKIFTPLFTTKAKGQGFGLSVCKKLIDAHNGEITFESEAGKGTTFKIKLPLNRKVS